MISSHEGWTIVGVQFIAGIILGIIFRRYIFRGTAYVYATHDPIRVFWGVLLATLFVILAHIPIHIIFHHPWWPSEWGYAWNYTWSMAIALGAMLGYQQGGLRPSDEPKPFKAGFEVIPEDGVIFVPPIDRQPQPSQKDIDEAKS